VQFGDHPIENDGRNRKLGDPDRELEDIGSLLRQLVCEFVKDEHLKLEISWHEISYCAWQRWPPSRGGSDVAPLTSLVTDQMAITRR